MTKEEILKNIESKQNKKGDIEFNLYNNLENSKEKPMVSNDIKQKNIKIDDEIISFLYDIYNKKEKEINLEVQKIDNLDELKIYRNEIIKYNFPLSKTYEFIGRSIGVDNHVY